MTTYYVAKNGVNSGGGGSSSPWLTLNYAYGRISNGDTVRVRAGTYQEALTIAKTNVTFIADDLSNRPVIDGKYHVGLMNGAVGKSGVMPDPRGAAYLNLDGSKGIVSLKADGIRFEGFVIQNVAGDGFNIGGNDVIVRGNEVFFTYASGITSNPSSRVSGILIENNVVRYASMMIFDPNREQYYSCSAQCVVGSIKVGKNGSNSTVRGNEVAYGFGEGINVGKDNIGTAASPLVIEGNFVHDCNHTGIYVNDSRYVIVRNNTVCSTNVELNLWDGDAPAGIKLYDEKTPGVRDIVVYNNLVVNMGVPLLWGGRYTASTGVYVGYNTFVGGPQADAKGKPGIIIDRQDKGGTASQKGVYENNILDYSMSNAAVIKMNGDTGANGVGFRNNAWSSNPPASVKTSSDVVGALKLVKSDAALSTSNYLSKNNTTAASLTVSNNLNVNNYRLLAASPAIGAGSSHNNFNGITPPTVTTDHDGGLRSDLNHNALQFYDMGAFEYGGVVPNSVSANFSGTPRTGASPLSVTFTDLSSATGAAVINAWSWNFGDSGTSTSKNPTHNYAATGTYTVALTVQDTARGLSNTLTLTAYVTVNSTPSSSVTAAFSAAPRSTSVGGAVVFTDLSTVTGTAVINSWLWSFGDQGTSTLQNPTHVYAAAGTYTVTLTVTDTARSLTDGETKTGYITISNDTVTADFTQSGTGGAAPYTVRFTDTSSATGSAVIDSVELALGNGVSMIDPDPLPFYTYSTPGIFTPSLTVRDTTRGLSSSKAGSPITVTAPPTGDGGGTVDVVRFKTGTTTAPVTVNFNLNGNAPSLVLLFMSAAVTAETVADDAMLCVGAVTSGEQWCSVVNSNDGNTPPQTEKYETEQACLVSLTAGAVTGRATRSMLGANKLVLAIPDAFPASYLVTAVAFAGAQYRAKAGAFTLGVQGLETTLHSLGLFDWYFMGGAAVNSPATVETHAETVLGFTDADTQISFTWRDVSGEALSKQRATITSEDVAVFSPFNMGRATIQDYTASRLKVSVKDISRRFNYAAIDFTGTARAATRLLNYPATIGVQSYEFGFQPVAALLVLTRLGMVNSPQINLTAAGFTVAAVNTTATLSTSVYSSTGDAAASAASRADSRIVLYDGDGTLIVAGDLLLTATGFDINWTVVTGVPSFFMAAVFAGAPPVDGPTPRFEADTTTPGDGIVQFSDLSNPNGAAITDWLWNFGDNRTSDEQNPLHEYEDLGTYSVTLTVTNSNGSETVTRDSYIQYTDPSGWLLTYDSRAVTNDSADALYGDDSGHPLYGFHEHSINLDGLEIDAYPEDLTSGSSKAGKARLVLDLENAQLLIIIDGVTHTISFD